jgi:hypothetical protein
VHISGARGPVPYCSSPVWPTGRGRGRGRLLLRPANSLRSTRTRAGRIPQSLIGTVCCVWRPGGLCSSVDGGHGGQFGRILRQGDSRGQHGASWSIMEPFALLASGIVVALPTGLRTASRPCFIRVSRLSAKLILLHLSRPPSGSVLRALCSQRKAYRRRYCSRKVLTTKSPVRGYVRAHVGRMWAHAALLSLCSASGPRSAVRWGPLQCVRATRARRWRNDVCWTWGSPTHVSHPNAGSRLTPWSAAWRFCLLHVAK